MSGSKGLRERGSEIHRYRKRIRKLEIAFTIRNILHLSRGGGGWTRVITAVSVDKMKSGKREKRSNRMKSTCIAEEDVVSRAERTGIQTKRGRNTN